VTNIVEQIEQEQIAKILNLRQLPKFKVGDVIKVALRVASSSSSRVQVCQGLVISRRNRGLGSSFLIRKVGDEHGVEYYFPLYSPLIESITVVRKGIVRKAKLYYFRNLTGKAARIKEDRNRV
jgi:large subunit ribosomal protein L19